MSSGPKASGFAYAMTLKGDGRLTYSCNVADTRMLRILLVAGDL